MTKEFQSPPAEHLHNLSPYSLHSMIEVSPEAWHAILYLVTVPPWQYQHPILYLITHWQYPQRLGMLITPWQYPPRLGMLSYISSPLGSIIRGLACYSVSYHALAVSSEALHAILYLITPWQYQPRLAILYLITPWQYPPRLGMLFYILSRLGSIRRGLACYSIS